jgi:hypothetical protein
LQFSVFPVRKEIYGLSWLAARLTGKCGKGGKGRPGITRLAALGERGGCIQERQTTEFKTERMDSRKD